MFFICMIMVFINWAHVDWKVFFWFHWVMTRFATKNLEYIWWYNFHDDYFNTLPLYCGFCSFFYSLFCYLNFMLIFSFELIMFILFYLFLHLHNYFNLFYAFYSHYFSFIFHIITFISCWLCTAFFISLIIYWCLYMHSCLIFNFSFHFMHSSFVQ